MHFYCVSHGKTTLHLSPLHETTTNPIAYPFHFHNCNRMQASKAQKPFKMVPFSSIIFSMKEAPTIYQMNLVIELGWSSS
jgi:hypothetical protein